MLRQQELEANTNNASGSNIAGYQAQNTNNYDQDDDIYGDQQYPLGPAGTPPPSCPPSQYFSLPPIVHMDSSGLHWTLPKITVFGKDYLWYAFRVRGLGLGI